MITLLFDVFRGNANLFAQEDVVITFRYYQANAAKSERVHFPGEFNNWGPNSAGSISSGSVSQGDYNSAQGYWYKTVTLKTGTSYAYKIYIQKSANPTDWSWHFDPLHAVTSSRLGNENSEMTVSNLNIFQFGVFPNQATAESSQAVKVSSQTPTIAFGLFYPASKSLSEFEITLNGTAITNPKQYRNTSTGIFEYKIATALPPGSHTLNVRAKIDSETQTKSYTFIVPDKFEILTPNFSTQKEKFKIGGKVYVSSISNVIVKVGSITTTTPVTNGSFIQEVSLSPGANVVEVTADAVTQTVTITKEIEDKPKAKTKALSVNQGVITLTADGSERATSYVWQNVAGFDLGLNGKTGQTVTVTAPSKSGDYPFMMIAESTSGKKDTVRNYFTIERDGSVKLPEMWENPNWVKEARIYSLFAKSATNATTNIFASLLNKGSQMGGLEHIKRMGYNVIWLLPVMKVQGNNIDNGIGIGYNIIDFYNLADNYGTAKDFKAFIDEAHRLELKVILDVTPNHTGRNHPWSKHTREVGEASPYWTWYQRDATLAANNTNGLGYSKDSYGFVYFSGFSDALMNFEWSDIDARKAMIDVYSYWLKKYDLDGFRFDVYWGPHRRYGRAHFDIPLREELKRIKGDIYLLGETEGTGVGTEVAYAGNLSSGMRGGLDAAYDWNLKNQVQKSWSSIATTSGINSLHNALHNSNYYPSSSSYYLRFLENQDEERITYRYQPTESWQVSYPFNRSTVAMAALMMAPGNPMIYAGQEVGFGYPSAALRPEEPDLNVRRRGTIDWNHIGKNYMIQDYQKLTHIRKQFPALWTQKMTRIDDGNSLIYAYLRPYEDQNILAIMNFSNEKKSISLNVSSSTLFSSTVGDNIYLNELMNGGLSLAGCPSSPSPDPVATLDDGTYFVGSAAFGSKGTNASRMSDLVLTGKRPGMVSGLAWLKVGKLMVVQYSNNAISASYPMTVETIELTPGYGTTKPKCLIGSSSATATDSISIPKAGMYHVVFDLTDKKTIVTEIVYFSILGSATDAGWDDNSATGTNRFALTGTGSQDGATFEASNIKMGSGEYKFRWNGMWAIYNNPGGSGMTATDTSKIPGLQGHFVTNIGGSITAATFGDGTKAAGNEFNNMKWDQANAATPKGIYKWTLKYSKSTTTNYGLTISFTKTGDVAKYDGTQYNFAIVGSATPNKQWGETNDSYDFARTFASPVYTWTLNSIELTAGAEDAFKIRANNRWSVDEKEPNIPASSVGFGGWPGAASYSIDGTAKDNVEGPDNFKLKAGTGGKYKIVMKFNSDTDAATVEFTKLP
ncbi:hypothetical protein CHS0354_024083 [Potamilus streckersoni]|uniref:Glycosyl hydrolase family 13 catalytic domain-containing protein n=1 Tax=Potamilus streckersoni TaxID=2493646 RepID=A0AAE0RZT3_9BIVA|nr:hypothetical protein CHS0354_024083 [Potamilus streckersoni]